MIKIENDVFYMSAGETCYIIKTDGKTLTHVYYGKRVEPEDDLASLCGDSAEFIIGSVSRGGKKITPQFEFVGAEELLDKPICGPTLAGGKTLKLGFIDQANMIALDCFYTPYPRGGFSRRIVIKNEGDTAIRLGEVKQTVPLEIARVVTVGVGGSIDSDSNERAMKNYAAVTAYNADETAGEVYGFLNPFYDGEVAVDRERSIAACLDSGVAIEPNGVYRSPELLAVYADTGLCGSAHVFHDILRENMYDGQGGRIRTVLFLPNCDEKNAAAAAHEAYELGCDVIAVDGGLSHAALARISDECKRVGISLGVRLSREINGDGAFFDNAYCKESDGGYLLDLSVKSADKLIAAIGRAVENYDLKYVMLDLPKIGPSPSLARAIYLIKDELKKTFPEMNAEWGLSVGDMHRGFAACYPGVAVRTVVNPLPQSGLKLRFDCATMGELGYEFNPTELDDGIKRAVRAQILSYQDDAPTVMDGDLYHKRFGGGYYMMSVSKDKSRAYAVCVVNKSSGRVKLIGLDEHNLYNVRETGKTYSGAALAHFGLPLPSTEQKTSFVIHLRQVADYE